MLKKICMRNLVRKYCRGLTAERKGQVTNPWNVSVGDQTGVMSEHHLGHRQHLLILLLHQSLRDKSKLLLIGEKILGAEISSSVPRNGQSRHMELNLWHEICCPYKWKRSKNAKNL